MPETTSDPLALLAARPCDAQRLDPGFEPFKDADPGGGRLSAAPGLVGAHNG